MTVQKLREFFNNLPTVYDSAEVVVTDGDYITHFRCSDVINVFSVTDCTEGIHRPTVVIISDD